ncbi:MAG: tetratricopeptide repeat protein [Bacteroidales bacterium]|nr:tetratricopeptide repeat protein [Bacteroidales bacterium]
MKKDLIPKKKSPLGKNISHKKTGSSKTVAAVPKRSYKANRYFILSFFLFAFILYGNTIFNKYAVDDNLVTNNEVVKQGFKAIPQIFSTRYFSQQSNVGSSSSSDYRPIVKTLFAIEYQLWGEKPGRSHAVNILIYWALSVFLFFILKRLLHNYNILFPFLITLLFMAHPVHTEVVASLKNRDELLAFICGLGSLWFMLEFAEHRKVRYVLLAVLVFFIGYLSKSSILPFLFLIPLALHFFTCLPGKKIVLIFLAIFAVILIAQLGPRLFLPQLPRTNFFIENPLYFEKSLWIRLGTGFISLLFYLKMLLYPYPLLYYYGYNMIPVSNLANIWALVSLLVYAGLFVFALRKFREKHLLSFAILWYLIAIAMYSNVVFPVVGIVGERFVFNASLGFCLAVVYLLFKIFRTNPQSLTIEMDARLKILAVLLLLLIPYTVLSVSRNRDWRNLFDLYSNDIKSLNNSAKANIDYGGYLMGTVYQDPNFLSTGSANQFKYQVIVSHFRRALDVYPDNYLTTNDLGTVYLFIGKNYDSAVYFLQKAIALDPTLQPAWVNLGMAYREQKQYQKAIDCYEHILKVNPNQVKAVFALANVYNDMGEFDRAVQMNEEMMKLYPGLEMPYVNIGNYHMLRQDTVTAVAYWEKAASINPSFELCIQLNTLYLMKGDNDRAAYYYRLGEEIAKQSRR